MAGLLSEYVSKYVRQISDGTPPKAEYVCEARSPRVLGGQALVQAFAHIMAKHSTEIEPFVDLEVQYAIGDVVSSLVHADKHVDGSLALQRGRLTEQSKSCSWTLRGIC